MTATDTDDPSTAGADLPSHRRANWAPVRDARTTFLSAGKRIRSLS